VGHIEAAPAAAEPRAWDGLLDDARDWARGRFWPAYGVLLAILVYIEVLKLRDVTRWTIFYGITLAFHEMGHLLFAWAPHLVTAAMGSVFQLAVPIATIVIFLRQPDYFGVSVGGFWLSYSMFELSAYVADARSKDLPLVGFASQEDLEHDWAYILGKLHMLPLDHFFGFLLKAGATLIGIASCVLAVWLLMTMIQTRKALRNS
jgi:hypothetical protein